MTLTESRFPKRRSSLGRNAAWFSSLLKTYLSA